jgi:hypothetical protein
MQMRKLGSVFALAVFVGACGGDEGGQEVTAEEAAPLVASTLGLAADVQARVVGKLQTVAPPTKGDELDGVEVRGGLKNFSVSGRLTQASGGALALSGGGGAPVGGAGIYQMQLMFAFTAWKTTEGDTIDGELALEFAITKALPPTMSVDLSGDLTVAGTSGEKHLTLEVQARYLDGRPSVCGSVNGTALPEGACLEQARPAL